MQIEYSREIDAAVVAAQRAAELIRTHRDSDGSRDVREKGRHDLVTEVDVLSQDLIVSLLQEEFPEYGFLVEEDTDRRVKIEAPRRWVIDPIDGTTNFAHRVPPYSVSIALLDRNVPVVGVVVDVVSGELFTAHRGEGSYLNGRRIRISQTHRLDEALISTGFPYRSVDHVDEYLAVLREFMVCCRGVRRHGSAAIDLAYLAAGRFDGFFETGLMPWDVAAGIVLIRESGGRISTFSEDGDPVFDGQILASNGRIHVEMKAFVQPLADVVA